MVLQKAFKFAQLNTVGFKLLGLHSYKPGAADFSTVSYEFAPCFGSNTIFACEALERLIYLILSPFFLSFYSAYHITKESKLKSTSPKKLLLQACDAIGYVQSCSLGCMLWLHSMGR